MKVKPHLHWPTNDIFLTNLQEHSYKLEDTLVIDENEKKKKKSQIKNVPKRSARER